MNWRLLLGGSLVLGFALALSAQERTVEPLLYDLVINGESFSVEANRLLKLESKKHPGTTYEVALRIAQVQRLVLNNLQLDYDRGYEVSEDAGGNIRTATLKHPLGVTLVLSDLGESLDAAQRNKVLSTLQGSMEKSFRADNASELKVAQPHQRKFRHAAAEGVTLQYQDASGAARTCLVYVLTGEGFAASCIVQFSDEDHEDILPLVKQTLESVKRKG